MTVRKRIIFYGDVQGVGFRYISARAAREIGLTGWVRNEYDGSVMMEVQGTEEMIDRLILALDRAIYIQIKAMDVKKLPIVEGEGGFGIRM